MDVALLGLPIDGRPGWTLTSEQEVQLAAAGDTVLVTTEQSFRGTGTLTAVEAATGTPLWQADGVGPDPVAAGELVYMGLGASGQTFAIEGCGTLACPPLATLGVSGAGIRGLSVTEGSLFVSRVGSPNELIADATG